MEGETIQKKLREADVIDKETIIDLLPLTHLFKAAQ
jgi:hypothetical protein